MVQLSIQARRLEPKGTGDDAVSEDAANDRVARDTVLDSSTTMPSKTTPSKTTPSKTTTPTRAATPRIIFLAAPATVGRFADSEAESLRVLPTIPDDASQEQHALCDGDAREHVRGARDGYAAPELVAALAALGIDVADGRRKGRRRKGRTATKA